MNKAFAPILAIASVAIATTFTSENTQQPFDVPVVGYSGFDLDLNERRLIQLEGQEPVWVTELDKVSCLESHSYHSHRYFVDQPESRRDKLL